MEDRMIALIRSAFAESGSSRVKILGELLALIASEIRRAIVFEVVE